jgi:hypothetical protein
MERRPGAVGEQQGDLFEPRPEPTLVVDDYTEVDLYVNRRPTIDEQFKKMLSERPDVYTEFVQLALKAKRSGRKRFGAKSIAEILRWNRMVERNESDDFAINNIFTSRLARKAMEDYPELAGFFETRELKSE